jgi:hypothetical protein
MMMALLLLSGLGMLGNCGETARICQPCVDDYKTKSMPPKREYFCPNGCVFQPSRILFPTVAMITNTKPFPASSRTPLVIATQMEGQG